VGNGADLAGRRILVVEDEFLLAMELEALLKRHGCLVLGPVPTVARALAILDRQVPEMALLDVNLRGERATTLAVALRDLGVPFVLITGYSERQLSEPELRAAPRLEKPVNCRALGRAMADALEAARADPGF
jgi:two-component SAPR family response regulator